MPTNKRITDLSDYTSVLPYASEMFGIYQPMLGWRSRRRLDRLATGTAGERQDRLLGLRRQYEGRADIVFNADDQIVSGRVDPGQPRTLAPRSAADGARVLTALAERLRRLESAPCGDGWRSVVNEHELTDLLNGGVYQAYRDEYQQAWQEGHSGEGFNAARLKEAVTARLREESAVAGLLVELVDRGRYQELKDLFYATRPGTEVLDLALGGPDDTYRDPYLDFDPTKQISDVTLSPIGIVHLFRQYFFELDTFLGTPVGHVWLSPGSSVELIEVSTRRSLVEKTVETALETTSKSERATTEEEEISDAVKQDNRDDMKLGFSSTVNQSWGTGNATATGSLNLDKTQQTAREQGHKRMRQQSEKLSTEIRQNFKSTFKTVTETLDSSSKRYVLANTTPALVNYELRRKMRQVGVQIQDIGSYLCWETFVDDPGKDLALPHLVHIAKPADLVLVPNPKLTPMPPKTLTIGFSGEAVWNFPDNSRQNQSGHAETRYRFVPLATLDIPGVPNGYEIAYDVQDPFLAIDKTVVAAEDDESWGAANWAFLGMITPDAKRIMVGVSTAPGGLAWDDRITFKVSGAVTCRLLPAAEAEINTANQALVSAKLAADEENKRKLEQAYLDAVHERVTLASKIEKRRFEHLREEERTIVHRSLIRALMSERLYNDTPDTTAGHRTRHVLSELINSIFDIEKMLYFVAPEWWKPRRPAALALAGRPLPESIEGTTVEWADDRAHGKYFITDASAPATLGSSLGWLLQLDGDELRNAFLNAPWVKAVLPIRPGKEEAAVNWLRHVGVEGTDGLDAAYSAPPAELAAIRTRLLLHDPHDPVRGHAEVTIEDAIRDLCHTVADKHIAAATTGRYPKEEPDDDNRVTATPVERVFEHGFYPLQGGFKARTEGSFEVCSQWIEVLPTDQVVPVEVAYDPKTGRQK
ncbi:hypothetical protein AB0D08_30735 [Kitasatospora sp. NPDC048540]|uniref:hypothetical protein n=1 Tax=Kitasatospora sp. NPDC048540 TaxID=3155634 RepID=UPI003405DAEC